MSELSRPLLTLFRRALTRSVAARNGRLRRLGGIPKPLGSDAFPVHPTLEIFNLRNCCDFLATMEPARISKVTKTVYVASALQATYEETSRCVFDWIGPGMRINLRGRFARDHRAERYTCDSRAGLYGTGATAGGLHVDRLLR